MANKRYASLRDRIVANSVVSGFHHYGGSWCWEWTGKRRYNKAGMQYGRINVRVGGKHKTVAAHRASVFAFSGIWSPRHMEVKHLCNNSVCVNPKHLENGTHSENMKQCYADGRSNLCRRPNEDLPCPF